MEGLMNKDEQQGYQEVMETLDEWHKQFFQEFIERRRELPRKRIQFSWDELWMILTALQEWILASSDEDEFASITRIARKTASKIEGHLSLKSGSLLAQSVQRRWDEIDDPQFEEWLDLEEVKLEIENSKRSEEIEA
jgi:hypothetical protein